MSFRFNLIIKHTENNPMVRGHKQTRLPITLLNCWNLLFSMSMPSKNLLSFAMYRALTIVTTSSTYSEKNEKKKDQITTHTMGTVCSSIFLLHFPYAIICNCACLCIHQFRNELCC